LISRAIEPVNLRLWWLGLCLTGVAATCLVVTVPGLSAIALTALWCLLLFAFAVGKLSRLNSILAVADTSSHVVKRLVFLLGHQPPHVYFALTAMPSAFLLSGLVTLGPQILRARIPKSAGVLIAFLCWSLTITLWSPPGIDWQARAAAVHQHLFPVLLFLFGLAADQTALTGTAKVLIVVSGISVVYGLIQFVGGPTPVDTAWSEGAYSYSLQAAKVHAYLHGANQEFRPFSIYADPLTWGLLLVAVFVLSRALKESGDLRLAWVRSATIFTVLGLFLTLTRTPWVAFFVTLIAYRAFVVLPGIRRPWLVLVLAVVGFWVIVSGGQYALQASTEWKDARWYESRVASRYTTLGTLSARVGAGDILVNLIAARRLLGEGFGYNSYFAGRLNDFHGDAAADSHNFVVELLLYLGLPGLILYLSFYWQWLREMFSVVARGGHVAGRSIIWIVAFSLGGVVSGYLNGMTFMSSWFFLLLGVGVRQVWLCAEEGYGLER
jgi:hypothetical protein